MAITNKETITVEATITAPVKKVWSYWTEPKHITRWNYALDSWHTPRAENDLRDGGRFSSRMEAKDGSEGFDFSGEYSKVEPYKQIKYVLDDDRKVQVLFVANEEQTSIIETFEAELENSVELQRTGWQAILDNFKKYVEASENSQ
jgi:uncharacterized protein YndB with AHSA1/START domain